MIHQLVSQLFITIPTIPRQIVTLFVNQYFILFYFYFFFGLFTIKLVYPRPLKKVIQSDHVRLQIVKLHLKSTYTCDILSTLCIFCTNYCILLYTKFLGVNCAETIMICY